MMVLRSKCELITKDSDRVMFDISLLDYGKHFGAKKKESYFGKMSENWSVFKKGNSYKSLH